MIRLFATAAVGLALSATPVLAAPPHNVILFVPDGLRSLIVTPETAPALAALRDQGVAFPNSHSLFPTFTTPNASAMATGHYLGDTGDFSNTIYTGYPVPGAGNSVTPFLESDPVLGDVDEHFSGDYLNETTLLKAARNKGYNTATIGKLGPALIFDHTERSGEKTVVIDDQTGTPKGIPLSSWLTEKLTAAGLPVASPTRGDNGKAGNATTAGTTTANVDQQKYFVDVLTKVVLPKFKQEAKPFVVVYWSRDPDGTQHNQGDSLNQLTPGINGPTSMAAIRNADANLAAIRQSLKEQGLDQTTDIVVSADHGFSTISKQSRTSSAAQASYADVPSGFLPPGFLAIDLANALDLPLWDPDQDNAQIDVGKHSKFSNGLIGTDPKKPAVVVAANGGSDLVYLPPPVDRRLAAKVVKALMDQDYVSGLFVDDSLGKFPGTLPLSSVNLKGTAITPLPAISVNFKSVSTGCAHPELCTAEVSDTGLQQGQGMHGSFSRGDTHNFTAAIGPDFKAGYVDPAPVSNADVGKTLAALLQLDIPNHGKLIGRVISEALPGGHEPSHVAKEISSPPSPDGYRTVLRYQQVGNTRYFDAAGFPGRTVGLDDTP
ncbi:alkaline phosphatase family protein [Telmatospirillum siberiense]|uniref:Alkaline phosphatase family protein n=1 Tax=Telmatospirillum siberiense TaxID=382514 RepID=A0A2N3PTW6_9PROT|nr:alkaline phosphatase family protein [Telmatospirillum siberiense]PKU23838.1 alkaline phosphatase family protein [Telmatospirillum siberiense]